MDAPPPSPPAPSPAKRPRRRLSTGRKALFGLLVVGFILGAAEGGFRAREVVRKRRKPRLPTMADPYTGTRLIPGARYDFKTKADINEQGLRGPEVARAKAAGTTRIACVGGSTTFGLYDTDDAATWPAQLGALLAARGARVEMLNGGVPGWTLRQNLTDLELRLFAFDLDVVVCYQGYNDLMSNVEHLTRPEGSYRDDSFVDDVAKLHRPAPEPLHEKSALLRFFASRYLEEQIVSAPKVDRVDKDGLAAYERNLRRLVRRCTEQGARLVLCTQPHAYRETYEASKAAGVPDLDEWVGLFPLTYPRLLEGMNAYNDATRRVAAESGAPLVDLAARMSHDVALYRSPIHHSDAGEVVIAKLVEEALLQHGVLTPR